MNKPIIESCFNPQKILNIDTWSLIDKQMDDQSYQNFLKARQGFDTLINLLRNRNGQIPLSLNLNEDAIELKYIVEQKCLKIYSVVQSIIKGLADRNKFKTEIKKYYTSIDSNQTYKKSLKLNQIIEQQSDLNNVQCSTCKESTRMCFGIFRE